MILLYWYCIFFGAIKPAHGQNMALVPRLQLGGTRVRSGRESLLGILSYVEMFLYQYCLDKLSLRLGGGVGSGVNIIMTLSVTQTCCEHPLSPANLRTSVTVTVCLLTTT